MTVNVVAPGFIQTDMTGVLKEQVKEAILGQIPLGHMGSPDDVARAVAFFASEESSYITGQVLTVDGEMTMHTCLLLQTAGWYLLQYFSVSEPYGLGLTAKERSGAPYAA